MFNIFFLYMFLLFSINNSLIYLHINVSFITVWCWIMLINYDVIAIQIVLSYFLHLVVAQVIYFWVNGFWFLIVGLVKNDIKSWGWAVPSPVSTVLACWGYHLQNLHLKSWKLFWALWDYNKAISADFL